MKAQFNITQIAQLLGRDKSTISRELRSNAGCRGYRAKQAGEPACKRSESSRNANTLAPWVKEQASELLRLQWSPEQIARKLQVSHKSLYLHGYADKAHGGIFWKNLRCQKYKRKRYASGRDRRGQIPNRRPLSERPAHIDKRLQVGHWECDTVIGANHKQAIVTVVERKSGFAVIAKISNKTSDLVGSAIIEALKPFEARVKTLTYDNGKEFSGHTTIDEALGITGYFTRPFASWQRGSTRTSMA
jgi:IS30 family transposase